MIQRRVRERRRKSRSSFFLRALRLVQLHPLFCVVGIWYALTGELFLFLLSALVAVQHECAHAFAAAKLGYKLNRIILMPFGAVIDVDLKGISFKDEIYVALCGPLCNLVTAVFFVALWWFVPTMYAFTDTVFYSSLYIALVNFLPAYPLDGGRILKCALGRAFSKTTPEQSLAERKADKICKTITLLLATLFLLSFFLFFAKGRVNPTLLTFGCFLFAGALGNRDKGATYEKIDLSFTPSLQKGVEIRRVAVAADCPVKDVFRFLARGSYLVLEVYEGDRRLFDLSQNQLAALFAKADTPYDSLYTLVTRSTQSEARKEGNFRSIQ